MCSELFAGRPAVRRVRALKAPWVPGGGGWGLVGAVGAWGWARGLARAVGAWGRGRGGWFGPLQKAAGDEEVEEDGHNVTAESLRVEAAHRVLHTSGRRPGLGFGLGLGLGLWRLGLG